MENNLPSGLICKPIEEIFKIKSGDFIKSSLLSERGKYNVFGGNGITGKTANFNISGKNIVIGRVGAKCGNVRLIDEKIWLTDNAFYIYNYGLDIYKPYLAAFLHFFDLRKTANQAAQPVISYKGIKDIQVPFPPLPEQQRIVAKLDSLFERIDKAIELAEQNIVRAQQFMASVLNDVFDGLDCERVKLQDACLINPLKSEVKGLGDIEMSFLPMVNLNEHQIDFTPKQTKKLKEVYTGYTYFKDGDVLLAKVTPCFENGKAGLASNLVNGIGFGSSEYYVLRANPNILPAYIYFNITTSEFLRMGARNMSGAVGLKRVTKDFLFNYEIPVPSIELQENIVKYFANQGTKLSILRNRSVERLVELKALKSSLLDAAFKGEL